MTAEAEVWILGATGARCGGCVSVSRGEGWLRADDAMDYTTDAMDYTTDAVTAAVTLVASATRQRGDVHLWR
jgi:hypothetical protein